MKRIIVLSGLMLIAVAAYNQSDNRSDNRRSDGNRRESLERVSNDKGNNRSNTFIQNSTNRRERSNASMNQGESRRSNTQVYNREGRNESRPSNGITMHSNNRNSADVRPEERRDRSNPVYHREGYERGENHGNEGGRIVSHVERNLYITTHHRYEVHNDHIAIYRHSPEPLYIRRVRYPFIEPFHIDLYWSIDVRNRYWRLYPEFHFVNYPATYRVPYVSAYDALDYIGQVATIYGKVEEVEYSGTNDEYYLYLGAWFPYQDFSIVLPGPIARSITAWPDAYFANAYVSVTGLVTTYQDKPEMEIRRGYQIDRYAR